MLAAQGRSLLGEGMAEMHVVGEIVQQEPALVLSPLSGNEQYCLLQRGLQPGTFCLGNHVFSLGLVGNVRSLFTSLSGGTNQTDATFMSKNRLEAISRLEREARATSMDGIVGVQAEIIHHAGGVLEFLATGGGVTWQASKLPAEGSPRFDFFTAACSGEQLSCLLDLGFVPAKMVFGTESYSRGLGGALTGGLRVMFVSGEVPEFSETFMAARRTALHRLREEAYKLGASFVSGVKLSSMNYGLLTEVSFLGTACRHPALPIPMSPDDVITSGFSEQELWSLCSQGYFPKTVVMAVSIYNMGMGNDLKNFFQNLGGGELTSFSGARHRVQSKILEQARQAGACEVLGLQTDIENFAGAGCIEFFAYGTAVHKSKLVAPQSEQLSPQHFMMERTAFCSNSNLNSHRRSGHNGELGQMHGPPK
ncbi:unnamed protein product [Polarella glacialis]|uniref:Heavy metal-binding domain-containing protein n=2 Tax=Polarella glacialis TaxID=89957 RepID=A0A813HT56_POLGL|nr:unnamed protein product [Polarella glacialis]